MARYIPQHADWAKRERIRKWEVQQTREHEGQLASKYSTLVEGVNRGEYGRTTATVERKDAPRYPAACFKTRIDSRTIAIWMPLPEDAAMEGPIVIATERCVGNKLRISVYRYDKPAQVAVA